MIFIEQQIAAARQKLLDLSMRNRLLNFKPSKTSTLQIIDEIPCEIFDLLVLQEKKLEFKPIPSQKDDKSVLALVDTNQSSDDIDATLSAEERHELWSLPDILSEDEGRHTDKFLQTLLESEPLQKRLFQIYQKSSSITEEQGYTVLFLALGFLKWKESEAALATRLAPLVLVPVEMLRTNVREGFSIRWTGEDLQTNQSLQAKLLEQQVALPDFETPESKEEIDSYFDQIREACSAKPNWTVEQGIYLNFFNFAKFVMYKDLDPNEWSDVGDLVNHPLLKAVLAPGMEEPEQVELFDERHIDEKIDFRDVYHVLDADPSQIAVIEDIKNGHNLVVEGPPGTGKSQTITNTIAELLAHGKTVLFVSEKMAALEVVKKRLDDVHLGDFCLELHSRKAKKKEVLQELQRTLNSQYDVQQIPGELYHQFDHARNSVNQYARDLRMVVGSRGFTVFKLMSEIESASTQIRQHGTSPTFVYLPKADEVNSQTWEEARSIFKSLADVLPLVSPVETNVWRGAYPPPVLPADEAEVADMLHGLDQSLSALLDSRRTLSQKAGMREPQSFLELDSLLANVELLTEGLPNRKEVFQTSKWEADSSAPDEIIAALNLAKDHVQKCLTVFTPEALELDCEGILSQFENLTRNFTALSEKFRQNRQFIQESIGLQAEFEERRATLQNDFDQEAFASEIRPVIRQFLESGESIFRFLNRRYRDAKRLVGSKYKAYKRRSHREIAHDIQQLERYFIVSDELNVRSRQLRNFFGNLWNGAESKSGDLKAFADWSISLITYLQSDSLGSFWDGSLARSLAERASPQFKTAIGDYERIKETLKSSLKNHSQCGSDKLLESLRHLQSTRLSLETVSSIREEAISLFGDYWHGVDSDTETIESLRMWFPEFRNRFKNGVFTDDTITNCLSNDNSPQSVIPIIEDVRRKRETFADGVRSLFRKLNADEEKMTKGGLKNCSFCNLAERIIEWKQSVHSLQPWSQYQSYCKSAKSTFATPLLEQIDTGTIASEDVLPTLSLSYAQTLLRDAFARIGTLNEFNAHLHQHRIEDFKQLDKALINGNRSRLIARLSEQRPRLSANSSPGSAGGILRGEFSKKRRHLPIRKLIKYAGQLILRIKPCFMMSPISIAQFLEATSVEFDVILFDEASQVRPEDALGALLRGKQLVVMGDTKQLPPTSFFDHSIAEIEEDEEEYPTASIIDIESILHQCKRTCQTRTLKWHYRSRHDSLVVVSNHEFYDDQLLLYPSSIAEAPHLGLKFHYLPETIYDRGGTSVNRLEARKVAEEVMRHFRECPDKSLGVGAFSTKQQQAILEEIELKRRENPQLEEFFSSERMDHFFVKNLETIQGDERDVIFLSIGYGFDLGRRLSTNFGPLNQEGGERRLNVLTTRAREKCVVFSNFRAADLPVDPTKPFGVRALRTYMEYAETRKLEALDRQFQDSDSPFEDSVSDFLEGKGYEIKRQVGSGGFRVDIGVVHPERPGTFALGIECDGAQYHSSLVARERDRLRQEILEGKGWNIHRVWSTDWYRNREEAKQVLIQKIEQAIADRISAPAPVQEYQVHIETHQVSSNTESKKACKVEDEFSSWGVTDYVVCADVGIVPVGVLHEAPLELLIEAIKRVVEVESPVHEDVVVNRLRNHWNLGRAGNRIRDRIHEAVIRAKRDGFIGCNGKFLWRIDQGMMQVRKRNSEQGLNIDHIAEDEIRKAIRLVLENQNATVEEEVVSQTARLLGFQRVKSGTRERISREVRSLLQEGTLRELGNGMINLREQ